ncbi:MAG: metallophosphoesterase [Thermoplasmata archaeon]|nr:metallophosphoesterase [Thermoplasmata archaeon]
MRCFFVSDLHGRVEQYKRLFNLVSSERPDAVFFGGDLLPGGFGAAMDISSFLKNVFFQGIRDVRNGDKNIRFFVILGNDDPRIHESSFIDADEEGLIEYVHDQTVPFGGLFVTGYSFVPPTPFLLKDWERYDVSRFVDVGSVSPEEGIRTVPVPENEVRYSTIAEDLQRLAEASPLEKTIFLFHSPPFGSYLDRVGLDGRMVDHAPVDVHVGSVAIRRFIEKEQPLLTLHGHIHESPMLTGHWRETKGRTLSCSAAHDGPELALVRFDTDDLANASRELVPQP